MVKEKRYPHWYDVQIKFTAVDIRRMEEEIEKLDAITRLPKEDPTGSVENKQLITLDEMKLRLTYLNKELQELKDAQERHADKK